MKAVRKRRGRVYRVSLATVTALMVAVGFLWITSTGVIYAIEFPLLPSRWFAIDVVDSTTRLYYVGATPIYPGFTYDYFGDSIFTSINVSHMKWGRFGFGNQAGMPMIEFPLWILLVALAIWPTLVAVKWIRSHPAPGCCAACGYDLRGSKQSTTCPECGEGIAGAGTG